MQDSSRELTITASKNVYKVHFDSSFFSYDFPGNSIVLSDSRFRSVFEDKKDRVIFVDATEHNKSLESVAVILGRLQELGANKTTTLVAVGGGIIQDLATLASSLYMRGLNWIYFPTTKMSQLDSCIGGKSSINLGGVKNLIGNIYPPAEIHIDYAFDSTLPNPDLASGFLEAIKISFAHSHEGFERHLHITDNYNKFNGFSNSELNALVLSQKKYFIENDEFDVGIRQNLNFGHTFGHAIESSCGYKVPHGVAIGLGMLMAIDHPGSIRTTGTEQLERAIINILKFSGFESVFPLLDIDRDDYINSFLSDKKHTNGNYSIIIPSNSSLRKFTEEWNQVSHNQIAQLLTNLKRRVSNEIQ